MDGKGIFYFTNGDKYYGEWRNDSLDKTGVYNFVNGDKYVGKWKNDQVVGEGIFHYADGSNNFILGRKRYELLYISVYISILIAFICY